jgi:hypothetical protein
MSNTNRTAATIQIADFANKNQIMIFTKSMQPLGIVHCFAKTEWAAINADGVHINWFTSKSEAIKAVSA